MRWWIGVGLIALFLLRIDLWWWHDDSMVAGLPIGLAFHIAFCLGVAAFFACVVRFAWPASLDQPATSNHDNEGDR